MKLIIVESPTKARTLSKFLGGDYEVEATMGHVKDLPKTTLGVDVENDFTPEYISVTKKGDVVKRIKQRAQKADGIYIATDPDREGEAIAAHVKEELSNTKGMDKARMARIVFHEITQHAVEEAIAQPHDVDTNLVNAQVARRVLDRLVGYKLSPLLWKKVRRGLSAGRVQSVAVRLIVEREKEIEAFKAEEYWEIFAVVEKEQTKKEFSVKLLKINDKKAEVNNTDTAKKVVSDLQVSDYKVSDVRRREVRKNPYPPFTTSTMTQAGARLFSWSAKKTMTLAQRLYEEGMITYHRTDSTNISQEALTKVREFINKQYGEAYLPSKARLYKTKAKVAQEAHEAIRPTTLNSLINKQDSKLSRDEEKLYELIWKKFVASQMNESVYDETAIDVVALPKNTKDLSYLLRASGQIMRFNGWRVIFPQTDEAAVPLPEVENENPLLLKKVTSEQKFTQPLPRFNEASLIKTLEKLGIGRPSTYAPTISTIQTRNYVEKDQGKFKPTPVGTAVNEFVVTNFAEVMDYTFTAQMEDELDKIATGERQWVEMMKGFWKPFEKKLGIAEKTTQRIKIETESLGKKCPNCKEGELVVRIGRFGKFISCSRFPECKHTEKLVEKIDMKCPDCGQGEVVVKTTKRRKRFYGCSRYPDCKWASWKKPIAEGGKNQELSKKNTASKQSAKTDGI